MKFIYEKKIFRVGDSDAIVMPAELLAFIEKSKGKKPEFVNIGYDIKTDKATIEFI